MAGRFPLYTYADVLGPIIAALKRRGWDVVRAVDQFPEGTDDEVHFEYAAREGRVLVTADEDQELCAIRWFVEGRPFRGLITRERELTPRNSTNLRSFREEHGKRPVLGIEEDEIEGHLESRFSGSSPRRRHGMGKVAADAIVDLDVEMEEAQGALAKYVREALKGPIVITTCGRPVGSISRTCR
jgi:predicted nuclease of predicted toxin-antitoxin system